MESSILSATIPAATEGFFLKYLLLQEAEKMQGRRPWKMGRDLIVIDQLMMNSCVASIGVGTGGAGKVMG